MKIKHLLSLSAFSVMSVCAMAQPAGSGTAEDPYQIKTASDLVWFQDFVYTSDEIGITTSLHENACAKLMNDIDMTGVEFKGIGSVDPDSDGKFNGVFNGCGYSIKNVYMGWEEFYGVENHGFFNVVGGEADIRNLFVENITIHNGSGGGAFVGYNSGHITNCCVDGTMNISLTQYDYPCGGFAGYNEGNISKCIANVLIKTYTITMPSGEPGEPDVEIVTTMEGPTAMFVGDNPGVTADCSGVINGEYTPCDVVLGPNGQNMYGIDVLVAAEYEAAKAAMKATATPVSGIRADKFMGADDRCTVYSISGSVVYSGAASGMKVAKPGIYVVKVGGATRKMYVK